MTFDAVVIGAGHNGLVAANLLADAGWDVVVLEAAPATGGAVRSAEVTAPGYLSDLCSAFYPLAAASPVLAALDLGEYGLTWRHAPAVLAHALADGRSAVLHRDPLRTAESVERFGAGDGERWLDAYAEWTRVGDQLIEAVFAGFPPVAAGLGLLRSAGPAATLRLARRLVISVRDLGAEMFAGDGAKLLLTGCALHTDLTPETAGSGAYGWLLAMVGQQVGFPVPVGGAQRLTDALLSRLAARGGVVECLAPVERVVVGGGRALGVVTADGRAWRARRAVLADVPAPVLYRDLVGVDHLPPRLVADLEGFRYDHPTLKVDWALSGPVPWRDPDVAGAGTVHFGGDLADLTRYSADLAVGDCPPRPFLLAGQMTTADPSRSPAGTESLWAYTHLPHSYGDLGRDHDTIAAQVERVEQIFDDHAPGFRDLIGARHVQGPADLADENPSLPGGALGGGTSAPSQQLLFRPIPGLGRADTPIDRLYLAGASAHPGGGVHGGPGANAARAALARQRLLAGELYRAATQAAHRRLYS
ncbi:MAG: FAD-dependent oxidoreductase [Micromonosporaceae bacterium]|nr:FAD-dependent oxidoreductase [Micromonosporaceae bacterium]